MPPRTYDFSQYQTPGQSFLSGVGKGFQALEGVRRDRKQERQGDDDFKLKLQKVLDDMNRERIKMGADPLASPLGGGAQGRPVKPTPGFNPNAPVPIPSPSLGAGGAATVQGAPEQVVGGLRRTIGGMLERFQGGYETPQLSTLTKTGPSEQETIDRQRHGYSLEEWKARHGYDMELERFEQDREDARAKADRGLRARELDVRTGIDGRNSLLGEINLRNAEINDLQEQVRQIETAKKNMTLLQFNGDLAAMQRAAQDYNTQVGEYERQITTAMEARNRLIQMMSSDRAAPSPQPDPISFLRERAAEAIRRGADPDAVNRRLQQEIARRAGAALEQRPPAAGFNSLHFPNPLGQ